MYQANTSGSAASNITFSTPSSSTLRAGTSVRQAQFGVWLIHPQEGRARLLAGCGWFMVGSPLATRQPLCSQRGWARRRIGMRIRLTSACAVLLALSLVAWKQGPEEPKPRSTAATIEVTVSGPVGRPLADTSI